MWGIGLGISAFGSRKSALPFIFPVTTSHSLPLQVTRTQVPETPGAACPPSQAGKWRRVKAGGEPCGAGSGAGRLSAVTSRTSRRQRAREVRDRRPLGDPRGVKKEDKGAENGGEWYRSSWGGEQTATPLPRNLPATAQNDRDPEALGPMEGNDVKISLRALKAISLEIYEGDRVRRPRPSLLSPPPFASSRGARELHCGCACPFCGPEASLRPAPRSAAVGGPS